MCVFCFSMIECVTLIKIPINFTLLLFAYIDFMKTPIGFSRSGQWGAAQLLNVNDKHLQSLKTKMVT